MTRRACLSVLTLELCLGIASAAHADAILGLQNTNGSAWVNLSSILNGNVNIGNIINGTNSAGSINVHNDVTGGITSLTFYYNGVTGPSNDAGSTLTCHNFNFSSGGNTSCGIYDPNNGQTYSNGAKTPNNLSNNSYTFSWEFSGTQTGNFNIVWSSFSGSGYTGCLDSKSSCTPAVPEPAGLLLLSAGISAMGLLTRRKRR